LPSEYKMDRLYILSKDLDEDEGLITFCVKSDLVKVDVYIDAQLLCSFDTDIRSARKHWRSWRYAGWERSR
jgi:hypothetical protein